MIKVLVWYNWNDIAQEMTIPEFQEFINHRDFDLNTLSIEFVIR